MRVPTTIAGWLMPGLLAVWVCGVNAAEDPRSVAGQLEDLKRQVIEFNRDLVLLEEDLLFPAMTRITVFLSLDTGQFLRLDSVKLKIDGEVVATHRYTETQIQALQRGGMQRLYIGNLQGGVHQFTVFAEGLGPNQRKYKKAASLDVEKDADTQALEVRIRDASADYEPDVRIVEWQ